MDWKEFNKSAFEKKYKVFAFITKKEDVNFFSEKTWIEFHNCFAEIIGKSKEQPTILSLQVSSDRKGFLPFGRMAYQETNLIKCVEKYRSLNNWKIYNTQIWSGNRKAILDGNEFPEFVFTIDYVSTRYTDHPIDDVLVCSFEESFYERHKELIETAIEKFKVKIKYLKGFVFFRTWFVGFLSPQGVASISSKIAGVDGVLTSIHLIDLETLEWNNKQGEVVNVVQI